MGGGRGGARAPGSVSLGRAREGWQMGGGGGRGRGGQLCPGPDASTSGGGNPCPSSSWVPRLNLSRRALRALCTAGWGPGSAPGGKWMVLKATVIPGPIVSTLCRQAPPRMLVCVPEPMLSLG